MVFLAESPSVFLPFEIFFCRLLSKTVTAITIAIAILAEIAVAMKMGVNELTVTDATVEFTVAPALSVIWAIKSHFPNAIELDAVKL